VEGLFGLYTYRVPENGELANAAIFYGDNGVGKSTLLRLVFHLLSAADDRGHRTALYQADFKCLEVSLRSGVKLTARVKEGGQLKVLLLEVLNGEKPIAEWEYMPGSKLHSSEQELFIEWGENIHSVIGRRSHTSQKKESDGVARGEHAYMEVLKRCVPTLFILNADRRLASDSIADPSDEVELRRTMQYGEPKKINELVARSREIALSQALGAAARSISRKAVLGANRGSMNVHSVYGDILKRLVSPSSPKNDTSATSSTQDLLKQLAVIDTKSAEHARYELATHLPTNEFSNALSGRKSKKTHLAVELLLPYVKSVHGRLDAVEPTYQLIDKFVSILNKLLRDKSVTFTLSQGFTIQNSLGVHLQPAQLSSGEQQLLLLFCYVLTARDTPTVFMIDEPEISLNIKWQRILIQSLLDITADANVQFIFASHSMELLAQHRSKVVKLVNQP
jgi:energy-coupling factor transporter ATP-binding protein EcfA2